MNKKQDVYCPPLNTKQNDDSGVTQDGIRRSCDKEIYNATNGDADKPFNYVPDFYDSCRDITRQDLEQAYDKRQAVIAQARAEVGHVLKD